MTEQRSGIDRRDKPRGGGRRATDAEVREAYRQLSEAQRLTREARLVLAQANGRLCDQWTPMELASRTGFSYDRIVRDIRHGFLHAMTIQRGKRTRIYIKRSDARAWLVNMNSPEFEALVALLIDPVDPAA